MIPQLPQAVGAVHIPLFLSPSRFGDLLSCKLSVLSPADAVEQLPVSPLALLGTVLHHVVREVSDGNWGDSSTANMAFDTILEAALMALEPQPVPLQKSVGLQRWFTRVARARSWALADAPAASTGVPRMLQVLAGSEGPAQLRVDVGHEAWIVWPDGRLRGRADRVDAREGGGFRVVENKSGKIRDRTGGLLESIGIQVGLYALAIEAVTRASVETVVRGDEAVIVPWDASARKSIREMLDRILAELPADTWMNAAVLASPGPHCKRCRLRPACGNYLAGAASLWVDQATMGRMPLDVWGEVQRVDETGEVGRVELRDDTGRVVVVSGLSVAREVHNLKRGDRIFFFDLETDQDRQHTERIQPSNFRELPPNTSSSRRRAFGLRLFR